MRKSKLRWVRSCLLSLWLCISFCAYAQHNIDVISYHFEIGLTDQSDAINGKAIICVKYLKNAAEVQFDLASVDGDKGMYAFRITENDMLLRSVHDHDILTIVLPQTAKAGETHVYQIEYMGIPKDGLIISTNKYGERTFFSDNWPNRAHQWIPCIDRLDDKASFEFVVTAPSHYLVVSNGKLLSRASAGNEKTVTFWRETTPLPTKVMVIGVADFAVKQFADSPDSIPVTAWVFPQDSTKGFYDYALAPAMLRFFSDYIAPYPYNKLANVQSKTIFGGMENASAIFYAEGSVTGDRKWEEVYAHEIAHQWFGDMASEKSFAHLWLSEGFATYLTHIYFQQRYGNDSFMLRLRKDRDDIIRFVRTNDHPVVDSTADLMSLLNVNSYQKGGWVLHMLRQEVGDSVFKAIIRSYYKQFAGGNAGSRDFEEVAERVSGRDLGWFFQQWLHRGGIPELKIKVKTGNELKVKVEQLKQVYRFTLELGVRWADGKYSVERVMVDSKEKEIEIKGRKVLNVEIDPGVKLLFRRIE